MKNWILVWLVFLGRAIAATTNVSLHSFKDLDADAQMYIASRLSAAAYCSTQHIQAWSCGARCAVVDDFVCTEVFLEDSLLAFIGVSHKLRLVLVSFRGTFEPANYLIDMHARLAQVPWLEEGVRVHAGFLGAYNVFRSKIFAGLSALHHHGDYYFLATGHSLGGALSMLAATDPRLRQFRLTSISFGSPRVGNDAFASLFGPQLSKRLVNKNDIVPHLPLRAFGYRHGPQEFWHHPDRRVACSSVDGEDDMCSNSLKIYGYFAHLEYRGVRFGPYC